MVSIHDTVFKPGRFFTTSKNIKAVIHIEDHGFAWTVDVHEGKITRVKAGCTLSHALKLVENGAWHEIAVDDVIAFIAPDTPAPQYGEAW